MAIISIDLLKTKFESGDFPRSRDYVDLIDTLSSMTGAGLSADSETTLTNKTISGSSNTISNIGNASLTNSSININSNQVSLGGSVSLTTDNISEGTNNKYYSDERVQDAIATAIVNGTGITKSYDDNANSLTISVDTDTISTKSYVQSEISNLVDAAPNALNTLNELAAALGDDSSFATTITNSLATKAPLESPTFTGTVSGITKSMVGLDNVDNTSDANKPISTATQTALDAKANSSDLSSHASDTTNIHGIENTADLATQSYVDQAESDAISTSAADATTKANAAQSAAEDYADGLAVNYDPAGSASSAQTAAQSYADSAISTHSSDTTNVHGIVDTSDLVLTDDARLSDNRTPLDGSVTDSKVAAGGLSQSSIANLTTDLSAKAPLVSPDLTGTPTAPTASAGTNTTQIATTAFVSTAVANLVDSAPSTLDTLNELASALADDPNFSTTITNSIASKAPTDSPTFTGTVSLPSTTSIGNASATEIGYLDGVTSAIQTQINTKTSTGKAIAMAIVFGG